MLRGWTPDVTGQTSPCPRFLNNSTHEKDNIRGGKYKRVKERREVQTSGLQTDQALESLWNWKPYKSLENRMQVLRMKTKLRLMEIWLRSKEESQNLSKALLWALLFCNITHLSVNNSVHTRYKNFGYLENTFNDKLIVMVYFSKQKCILFKWFLNQRGHGSFH